MRENIIKFLIIVVIFTAGSFQRASALIVNLSPGSLVSEMLNIKGTTDTALVVKGHALSAELAIFGQLPESIRFLDLSNLQLDDRRLPQDMLFGSSVTQIRFPEDIRYMDTRALAGSKLTSVKIPETVLEAGQYLLASSEALTNVEIPARALAEGTFYDCLRLSDLMINGELVDIPDNLFRGCAALTGFDFSQIRTIGAQSFRGCGLRSLDLEAVISVGEYAFADCPDLSEIVIPDDCIIRFGKAVFSGNNALSELPEWHSEIGVLHSANSSPALGSLVNAPTIGEAAFANNSATRYLTLGPSVTAIGKDAFRNNTGIENIDVKALLDNIPDLHPEAFSGLENAEGRYDISLYLHEGSMPLWQQHPVWSLFRLTPISTFVDIPDDTDDISIWRQGAHLEIQASSQIDAIQIYTLSGLTVYNIKPGESHVSLAVPSDPILIVRVTVSGHTYMHKL